ncbi:unnamed protein product [Danaus chrysippus]|uniref:(African queen) hypothetical protein n=1 Tax=Danaus chrysippus TaxID=151541 RepID=A0A8J2VWS8_9NEOP|nr:unnamed protein product [Danaus chrysippus]
MRLPSVRDSRGPLSVTSALFLRECFPERLPTKCPCIHNTRDECFSEGPELTPHQRWINSSGFIITPRIMKGTWLITYFRVVDRLGVGRGPRVEIIRGGLRHKYIVVRLTSPYNYPISVNVYVGCENKLKIPSSTSKIIAQTTVGKATVTSAGDIATTENSAGNTTGGNSTIGGATT